MYTMIYREIMLEIEKKNEIKNCKTKTSRISKNIVWKINGRWC